MILLGSPSAKAVAAPALRVKTRDDCRPVAAFEVARRVPPRYARAHAGRRGSSARLGQQEVRLGRTDEAAESCRQALVVCQGAVRLAPGYAPAHDARAQVFFLAAGQRTGDRSVRSAESLEVVRSVSDQVLSLAPGGPEASTLAEAIRGVASSTGPAAASALR